MSFPSTPNNNDTASVNGIVYQYNTANNTWTRIATEVIDVFGRSTTNNAYAQANTANVVFVQANSAYTWANNAYNHANVVFVQANSAYTQANTATTLIINTISPFLLMGG